MHMWKVVLYLWVPGQSHWLQYTLLKLLPNGRMCFTLPGILISLCVCLGFRYTRYNLDEMFSLVSGVHLHREGSKSFTRNVVLFYIFLLNVCIEILTSFAINANKHLFILLSYFESLWIWLRRMLTVLHIYWSGFYH